MRFTLKFVKNKFIERNYKPLFTEYKNARQKLSFICPNGHQSTISFDSFKNKKHGCKLCGYKTSAKKLRKNFNDIRKEFKQEDYILLSKENEYKNNRSKLKFICPNGHIDKITYGNFQYGYRCNKCGYNTTSKKLKKNFNDIQTEFDINGYQLLIKQHDYINVDQKLKFICPNGHIGSIKFNHFKNGVRCRKCFTENMFGDKNPSWLGGISFKPYSYKFNKKLKKHIKERDNYKCKNPKCLNNSKRLCIHHIDYNKKNCRETNLITLCNSCNIIANKNRNQWCEMYKKIIEKLMKE